MAVTIANLTAGSDPTDGTTFTTASVSPAANSVVLLTVNAMVRTSTNPTTPTISGNGLTWTLVASADHDPAGSDRATTFLFRGVGTPSSGAITITFSASMGEASWIVDEATGASTSAPVTQSNSAVTASGATSASTTLSAFGTGGVAYAVFGVQAGTGGTFTPEAGWTALGADTGTQYVHVFSEWKSSSDTSPSGSWSSGGRACIIAAEIAVGGSTPNSGTATGTTTWAGSAVGEAPPNTGTATGSFTFAGSAVGDQPPLDGTASGSYDFTGSASGVAPVPGVKQGTATGSFTFSGSATGSTSREGTATGAMDWTGTASGSGVVGPPGEGTAQSQLGWFGSASGSAPEVPDHSGSASGTFTFARGAAAGSAAHEGTVTVWLSFAAVVVGEGQDPTYTFEPPQYRKTVVPPLLTKWPRMSLTESMSVVRINGTLTQVKNPSTEQLKAAGLEGEDWFLGGHIYTDVPLAVGLELQAAGFDATEN